MKKLLSVFFAVVFAVSVLLPTAGAAEKLTKEESNAQVSDRVDEIEKKYGINITYEIGDNGYATISMNNLETLDSAFSSVTPTVVRQISSYYNKRNGSKIDITYVFASSNYYYNGGVLMAAFERQTSKIYVYQPKTAGQAIISGENPIALVHELGHAYHMMAMEYYGQDKMRGEWEKFNRGIAYDKMSGDRNPDETVFISGYAGTTFEEDFAETFAHTFARNRAGTGFKNLLSNGSNATGLGQKVRYIEKLLPVYLKDTEKSVENFRKIYSTPTSMTFEGLKFSGEYLQYIGYPQPKNILQGILGALRMTAEKSTWVRNLGAWRVVDRYNNTYFLFPGGTWTSTDGVMSNVA